MQPSHDGESEEELKNDREEKKQDERVDAETAPDVASLLLLPDFEEENNPDLPFECSKRLRVGVDHGFFRVARDDQACWERSSRQLVERMNRFGSARSAYCFPRSLLFSFAWSETPHGMVFSIHEDGGKTALGLEDDGGLSERTSLEIWEGPHLLRKTTLPARKNGLSVAMTPGKSLFLRLDDRSEGAEILLFETEFSVRDWKTVFLSLVLGGELHEAYTILRTRIFPRAETSSKALWLESFLQSVIKNTVGTPAGLVPVPALRGGPSVSSKTSVEASAIPMVGAGLGNRWPHILSGGGEVPKAVGELLKTFRTGEVPEERIRQVDLGILHGDDDEYLLNGWAAAVGWMRIERRDYEGARRAFEAYPPVPHDPFGLRAGARLAEHLGKIPLSAKPEPHVESNDAIWSEALSSFIV